jgi:hypothetical protein
MPPRLPMDQISFTDQYKQPDKSILKDWVNQMEAGYKATWPGSSFAKQIDVYTGKLGGAEKDLEKLIFYRAKEH